MKNNLVLLLVLLLPFYGSAQNLFNGEPVFQTDIEVKSTSVKDQANSGTCWAFATISFIESELLRMGKGEYDLSEMYIVRNTYPVKCENYLRLHKTANLGSGGQAHDVLNAIKRDGLVPEEVFKGIQYPSAGHNHEELDAVLKAVSDVLFSQKKNDATLGINLINNILDLYLGKKPETFMFKNKAYSPKSFWESFGIDVNDYVEFTSYSCYPFNSFIDLQIPDNWSHDKYYNIPIDDLMAVIDLALQKGYSVCWDGDVSGSDFSSKKGIATLDISVYPKVTQENRQASFDHLSTTDDHLMHIVGIAHDQYGNKYYKVKNSWGTDNKYNGFWYLSEFYVRLNTVAVMVNKNALPEKINKIIDK